MPNWTQGMFPLKQRSLTMKSSTFSCVTCFIRLFQFVESNCDIGNGFYLSTLRHFFHFLFSQDEFLTKLDVLEKSLAKKTIQLSSIKHGQKLLRFVPEQDSETLE